MATMDFRRKLSRGEKLAALGVGVGAGLGVAAVGFYLARLVLQRTPVRPPEQAAPLPRPGER